MKLLLFLETFAQVRFEGVGVGECSLEGGKEPRHSLVESLVGGLFLGTDFHSLAQRLL